MKNIVLAFFGFWVFAAQMLFGAAEGGASEIDLRIKAISRRVEEVAGNRKSADGPIFFVQADNETESRILKEKSYSWLKTSADFEQDSEGVFRLKSDRKISGCALSASNFESHAGEWKCLVQQYCGPLGATFFRCKLQQVNEEWVVVEFMLDDSMAG